MITPCISQYYTFFLYNIPTVSSFRTGGAFVAKLSFIPHPTYVIFRSDHNLYRSHFRIGNSHRKPTILSRIPIGSILRIWCTFMAKTPRVRFRLIPARRMILLAHIPNNLCVFPLAHILYVHIDSRHRPFRYNMHFETICTWAQYVANCHDSLARLSIIQVYETVHRRDINAEENRFPL